MKNKWIIASILIVALIMLCVASLFAVWNGVRMAQGSGIRLELGANNVSAKATEQKTISLSGPASLNVNSELGDVSVSAGPDGQISVTAEKTAWGNNDTEAQAALKDLKVIYEQTGNNVSISVQQPVEVNTLHLGSGGGSVKFTILVPAQTAVTLKSTAGELSLTGTDGKADLRTEFGALNLTDVVGEIFAESNNGNVKAENIGDGHKIELSSEFGGISVEGAQGSDISISSNNGKLDLNSVKAVTLLKLDSQFGDIHLANGSAKTAEVHTNNGAVRLEDLNLDGSLTAKSNFGDMTLTGVVASSYDLNSENGKISLDGARGSIKAHSNFGQVDVLNAQNATITLSSDNGGISFSGSLGTGPHSLSSKFGNIKLVLPAESAFDVDLQTEFGKISSDFEITVSGKELDAQHWTGQLNGGGEELTIKNNNGNITLQSSK